MTDTILLTVPSGPRGAGVVALVLGGLGSRLDLPVDRIDELALAAGRRSVRCASDDASSSRSTVLDDRLVAPIGPLEDGRGGRRGTPARARRRSSTASAAMRKDGHEWLELELARGETG